MDTSFVIRRLNQLLNEKDKEISFLKKSGILCKENRLVVYRFIDDNKSIFCLRWLCKKFGVSPNCYYNYTKDTSVNITNVWNTFLNL